MSATYSLFRLFWRPGVLLDLLVTTVFALMLSWVGGRVGQGLFSGRGTVFGLFAETGYPPSSLAPGLHFCLLAGAVLGVVTSFAMQDLLYCRLSWNLPGLERRLRAGLWWVAAIAVGIGAGAGALFGALDQGPGLFQGAAFGLAGFALGNQLWDPKIGRGFCFAAQLLLLGAVVSAPELQRGVEHVPWAAPLAALLFTALSIHRATKRGGLRTRALVPKGELGASFRSGEDTPLVNSHRGNANRLWSAGRVLDRRGWIRALQYENAGWSRGSWRGRVLWLAAALSLLACLVNFAVGWHEGGALRGSFATVAAGVFDPIRSGLEHPPRLKDVSHAVAFAAVALVVSTRLDLRRGVVYPLSRGERAEVVWRSFLHQGLTLLLLCVIFFVLIGLAAAWFAGVDLTLHRVPEVVVAALLTALVLPLLQWARLRFVDSGWASKHSLAFGAAAGAGGIVLLLLQDVAMGALRQAEPMTAGVVALGVVPLLCLIFQVAFRGWLRSWFATTDLV